MRSSDLSSLPWLSLNFPLPKPLQQGCLPTKAKDLENSDTGMARETGIESVCSPTRQTRKFENAAPVSPLLTLSYLNSRIVVIVDVHGIAAPRHIQRLRQNLRL